MGNCIRREVEAPLGVIRAEPQNFIGFAVDALFLEALHIYTEVQSHWNFYDINEIISYHLKYINKYFQYFVSSIKYSLYLRFFGTLSQLLNTKLYFRILQVNDMKPSSLITDHFFYCKFWKCLKSKKKISQFFYYFQNHYAKRYEIWKLKNLDFIFCFKINKKLIYSKFF